MTATELGNTDESVQPVSFGEMGNLPSGISVGTASTDGFLGDRRQFYFSTTVIIAVGVLTLQGKLQNLSNELLRKQEHAACRLADSTAHQLEQDVKSAGSEGSSQQQFAAHWMTIVG